MGPRRLPRRFGGYGKGKFRFVPAGFNPARRQRLRLVPPSQTAGGFPRDFFDGHGRRGQRCDGAGYGRRRLYFQTIPGAGTNQPHQIGAAPVPQRGREQSRRFPGAGAGERRRSQGLEKRRRSDFDGLGVSAAVDLSQSPRPDADPRPAAGGYLGRGRGFCQRQYADGLYQKAPRKAGAGPPETPDHQNGPGRGV